MFSLLKKLFYSHPQSKLSDEVSSNFHPVNFRLLLKSGSYFIGAKLLTCEIKSCSCGKLTFDTDIYIFELTRKIGFIELFYFN